MVPKNWHILRKIASAKWEGVYCMCILKFRCNCFQPKKRILVRPASVLCEKENTLEEKGTKVESETLKSDVDGKKVVKLTGVTLKDVCILYSNSN